jgi:hypothetical protein
MGYARLQLGDIRAQWNDRRCEPLVMSMAHLVPEDPNIDPNEFATDNFKFCLNRIVDGVVGFTMKPVLGLFQEQAKMTEPLQDVLNNLRGAAASLMDPITKIFSSFFDKFKMVGLQFARIFYKMMSAFDRVFAILVATVFAGMSLIKGVQNFVGFVIQVCIIILVILSILVIFLWFVMWPLIPVILLAIGFISSTVYAANVSGLSGSFCVAPGTLVACKRGWVPVEKIRENEELHDGSKVEGRMSMTGENADLVSIYGLIISRTHLLLHNNKWIPAGHHPNAVPAHQEVQMLYCLNTTSRTWLVNTTNGCILLRDWEELPDGYDKQWEDLIRGILKGDPSSCPGRPLFGPGTRVIVQKKGHMFLRDIKVGDLVEGPDDMWVRVLGIVTDTSERVPKEGPNNAVWRLTEGGAWGHNPQTRSLPFTTGYNLIVEGGMFVLENGLVVRDFTEVGAEAIDQTYSFVDSLLNGGPTTSPVYN